MSAVRPIADFRSRLRLGPLRAINLISGGTQTFNLLPWTREAEMNAAGGRLRSTGPTAHWNRRFAMD